jgi:hypothetical protein
MHPKGKLQIVYTTSRKLHTLSKTLKGAAWDVTRLMSDEEATNLTTCHEFAKRAELFVTVLQKRVCK